MRDYTKQPQPVSRTIESNPKAANQASITEILQRYKKSTIQPAGLEDEDKLVQGKFSSNPIQQASIKDEGPLQPKSENKTGLPDNLKAGIEKMSGYSMDDVKVHYNSDKPAQLNALAYAHGTDIHVGPGQEKHLPHEAWHVVQQKQGRVQPTMQMQGVDVNDNEGLEREADIIGEKAIQMKNEATSYLINSNINKEHKVIQAKLKQWKPGIIGNQEEVQLLTIANEISNAVDSAFGEFMSGNYEGASEDKKLLYLRRKSEYDEYKKTGKPYNMHPATSAGYVIEDKVNNKISSIQNIETQNVGLLKGSRPDIVIHTGIKGEGGNEILGLVDITAEKSIGHIFRKSGNWINHKNIIFVAEAYYPSINFDNMAEIVLTDEDRQYIDSIAEIKASQIEEYNKMCFDHFEEKG
ncbi:MAG: DUF4157 domain-containing protein, partial [Mediterranea sp.]|nr:DUF4157 domain-containing protein [Mediterranea sp.]